ncbi:hypothetical protein KSP39_PZI019298 [Platanthera zijinensis]|uniref:Uncharacterized protein n=1 Tax=Platanthera zijinensis TaxID=2320716 RepID=A0AAP0B1Z3_9ASPA
MKREGWQHGAQKTRSPSLHLTEHSNTGGGINSKDQSRPGGRSKLTGKNREGHSLPASKSRNKAKGAHKLRSCNVVLNHKLVSWRVVDEGHWPEFAGASASNVLIQLSGMWWNDEVDPNDMVEELGDQFSKSVGFGAGSGDGAGEEDTKEEDDNDDYMNFCEVGFAIEYVEGEDWCMVDEI